MNIPKIAYAALLMAAFLVVLPSCKDDNNSNDEPTNVTDLDQYKAVDQSSIAKATIAAKNELPEYFMWTQDFQDFTAKVNKFSNKMATSIGCESDGNTTVSPLSIFMALSMSAECANGETREQLLDALGVSYEELSANIQQLCWTCNEVFGDETDKTPNLIKSVNSLWIRDGVSTKDAGLKALTGNYYSDVMNMDFANSDVNSIVTSYIKNETCGFLSPDLQITPATALLLMNVVYLREVWDEFGEDLQFTPEKYDFVNYDNTKTPIKLLTGGYYRGRAYEGDKYRKFDTYTNSHLQLSFYVPTGDNTVDDIYNADVLDAETKYVYEDDENIYHTRCLFPEFKADFDGDIKNVVESLGVSSFFNSAGCDFSNLTDDEVYCGMIKHVAKLEVAKSGIEGAAVTAVMMVDAANMDPIEQKKDVYEDFVVDRDFVFVLSKDNVPVFTGVVKAIK